MPLTGGIRYPESALRFHSSGPPRRVISTHLLQGKSVSSGSRAPLCYAWECDVLPSKLQMFLAMRLIVRKSRRDGRRSPGLSLGSARRHHHHHHVTYVAGNLLHLARGVSCTHFRTHSRTRARRVPVHEMTDLPTALAGPTGALHAQDRHRPPCVTATALSHWSLPRR